VRRYEGMSNGRSGKRLGPAIQYPLSSDFGKRGNRPRFALINSAVNTAARSPTRRVPLPFRRRQSVRFSPSFQGSPDTILEIDLGRIAQHTLRLGDRVVEIVG